MKVSNLQKGFTLVEMIVSLAIFTIVALVAVGALLKITDANKKSQTLKSTINNLNFALESMSREMRVGSTYNCDPNGTVIVNNGVGQKLTSNPCPNGVSNQNWIIAFKSSKTSSDNGGCNLVFAYKYDPTSYSIGKVEQSRCNEVISTKDSTFTPITASEVKITNATIKVIKSSQDAQPYAWFHFKGYAGTKERTKTYFDIQTSVSQRISD